MHLSPMHGRAVHKHQRRRSRRVTAGVALVGTLLLLVGALVVTDKLSHDSGPPATDALPFDLPAQQLLKNSPRKVFAHYLSAFPISLDNAPAATDYYTRNYLSPAGEKNPDPRTRADKPVLHTEYGGLLRDRPLPRTPINGADWALQDMRTEVRQATDAGLDGFSFDMLALSGTHWDRLTTMLRAAHETDPDFSIMLVPDAKSRATDDPVALATAIAGLAKGPYGVSLFHLADGRLVVSPFFPERKAVPVAGGGNDAGAAFWRSFVTSLTAQGVPVAFVPCFLSYQDNADAYADFSYGFSNWGTRSPATNSDLYEDINDAHARGKIWMQPVALQDSRPSQSVFEESDNTENFRRTWQSAIDDGAEWVQLTTWNDYAEGTQLAPSVALGHNALDLDAYYLTAFKTGANPVVRRDVLYLSHRRQPVDATPTGGQTQLMTLRPGSSPARDTVEALTFLTAAARIRVTVGGRTETYDAPAGVSARLFPLEPGQVSAEILRRGQDGRRVVSPWPVQERLPAQDLTYYLVSSAREGVEVPDPR